jgi:hypothetical protein
VGGLVSLLSRYTAWYSSRSDWLVWTLVAVVGLVSAVFPWRAFSVELAVPWVFLLGASLVVRHLSYRACAADIAGPLNAMPETHVLALLAMLADPDVPEEWKESLEAARPYLEDLARLHQDVRELVTAESGKRRDKRVRRSRRVYGRVHHD